MLGHTALMDLRVHVLDRGKAKPADEEDQSAKESEPEQQLALKAGSVTGEWEHNSAAKLSLSSDREVQPGLERRPDDTDREVPQPGRRKAGDCGTAGQGSHEGPGKG